MSTDQTSQTNPAASAPCCTVDEIMAAIKPEIIGKTAVGAPAPGAASVDGAQVGGAIGDALILVLEQLGPVLINAILAHFHISKK